LTDNTASPGPGPNPSARQRQAANQLRATADQLQGAAAKAGQYGPAARQAAERLHSAASWLESREPADVLHEAREFARRRPGVVLGGAAVAALAIRRRPVMVLAGAAAAGLAARRLSRGTAAARHPAEPPSIESYEPGDQA
jgi:hypothetical protein